MITLLIILVVFAIVFLAILFGILLLGGAIGGILLIALDVCIGILPIVLIVFIVKKIKNRKKKS